MGFFDQYLTLHEEEKKKKQRPARLTIRAPRSLAKKIGEETAPIVPSGWKFGVNDRETSTPATQGVSLDFGRSNMEKAQRSMEKKWNSGAGAERKREIQKNIAEGIRNHPGVQKALRNNDWQAFRDIYDYNKADNEKKAEVRKAYIQAGGQIGRIERKMAKQAKNTSLLEDIGNKFQNSFDGVDWNPFDDKKMEYDKDDGFLETMGKSFANTVGKGSMYVLDKVGRLGGVVLASSEDNETYRKKNAEFDEERRKQRDAINSADWEQDTNQDTGMWGATKQWFRNAGRSLNTTMADIALKSGNRDLANFFADNSDAYRIQILKNQHETADTLAENILTGGLSLLGSVVYGTAGGALGGSKGALAGVSAFGYTQEYGSFKNELTDNGVNDEKAREFAGAYGLGASLLEGAFPASKVKNILGPSASTIVGKTYKQAFVNVIKEVGGDFLKEGSTEAMQELLSNVYKKQEGLIDGYMNNVGESFLLGGLVGGAVGGVTNHSTRELYHKMKSDVTVALDIVSGKKDAQTTQEYQLAKVVLENYQNLAKEKAVEMQDNENKVQVESVEYDGNKYAANVRVESPARNTTLQFGEVFPTKEEAIKDAMKRGAEILPETSEMKNDIDTNLDEMMANYETERMREQEESNLFYQQELQDQEIEHMENMSDEAFTKQYSQKAEVIEKQGGPRNYYESVITDRAQTAKRNTQMQEDVRSMDDTDFVSTYMPLYEEIKEKDNLSVPEQKMVERMQDIEYQAYNTDINKAIDTVMDGFMEDRSITEDQKITPRDIQHLAKKVYTTLSPVTMRATLRAKKNDFLSPSQRRILGETQESTIDNLLRDFRILKIGLQKIIDYHNGNTKPTKNILKLEKLLKEIRQGEYDALEAGDEAWDYFLTSYYDYQQNGTRKASRSGSSGRGNPGMVQEPQGGRTGGLHQGDGRSAHSRKETAGENQGTKKGEIENTQETNIREDIAEKRYDEQFDIINPKNISHENLLDLVNHLTNNAFSEVYNDTSDSIYKNKGNIINLMTSTGGMKQYGEDFAGNISTYNFGKNIATILEKTGILKFGEIAGNRKPVGGKYIFYGEYNLKKATRQYYREFGDKWQEVVNKYIAKQERKNKQEKNTNRISVIPETEKNASENIVQSLKHNANTENQNETSDKLYSKITSKDKPKITERYKEHIAKNKAELLRKIDNLNKLAMSRGIFREIGGTGKDELGHYNPFANKKTRGNEKKIENAEGIKLSRELQKNSDEYMSVVAHELGHALEWQLFGTFDQRTMDIFGEGLTPETQETIWNELKENTHIMEGIEAVNANPEYYYRPTELFARFIQRWFEEPIVLNEVAPTAMELFARQAVHNTTIGEYLEAIEGKIDEKQTSAGFEVFRDLNHRLQKTLGERAGKKAYETITHRNAMIARGKEVFGKELKKKFKNVKNVELLYEAIEATLVTKDGRPVFGTRDFIEIPNGRYQEYNEQGWSRAENQEGVNEGEVRMWNWRYTETEGKQLYEQLTEYEKQILKDFTCPADEAPDFFNRNKIAERYGIEYQIEGWIHRFWKDDGWRNSDGGIGKKLGDKMAGTRKSRTLEKGYVKDMQKALYKALVELESEEYFNNWLREFIPRISKPLAEGEYPKMGWTAVEGDFITGFLLPGQRNEYRVTENGTFKIQKGRFQVPTWVYQQFTDIAGILQERSTAYAVMDTIANLWQVNVLTHPGTAVTNGISGGLQFSLKILKNTYDALLTGNVNVMWKNFEALFGVFKDWSNTPNWMWGGDDSTYYNDVGAQKYEGKVGNIHKKIGDYGNIVLKPMQTFEEYWKKVIARSTSPFAVSHLNKMTKEGLPKLEISDREALDMMRQAIDLYGYDYENVPGWLEKMSKNPIGKLTLPFKRYMYKYFSMITEHTLIPIMDKNMPMKERLSRVLGFATWIGIMMAIYGAYSDDDNENTDNPNLPRYMNNRGKINIGKDDEGNEKWVRLVKYPGLNLIGYGQALDKIVHGKGAEAYDSLGTALNASTDGWNTMGPMATGIASAFGLNTEYDKYKTTSQKMATIGTNFIPGFRVLQDIAQIQDPYKRKTESAYQEFTRLIPFMSEELRDALRGKIYMDKVPVGESSTENIPRKNYPEDTALSLMTGIYTTRVNPEIKERYLNRYEQNQEEKRLKEERTDKENQIIEKYKDYDGNVTTLKNKIGREIPNVTAIEKRQVKNIVKKVIQAKYGEYKLVQQVAKTTNIHDKENFLKQLKSETNRTEYQKIVLDLRDAGIISKQMWQKIK